MIFAAGALAQDKVLPDTVKSGLGSQLVWYDTGGGTTSRVRTETLNADFKGETGVDVVADYNPDMTKFFAAMENGANIPWSIIDVPSMGDFIRARDAGYLEKLDPNIIDFGKMDEGTNYQYGFGSQRFGIVFTYNTTAFPADKQPAGIKDLYNLKDFPGKRCLFNYPQFSADLESALLADGVEPAKLYPLDLDRAFAKLDTIKSQINWWSNGDESIRMLSTGECSMGIAWNGRVFSAIQNDHVPLKMVWSGSLYSQSIMAIPKGAPNVKGGQALIAHFVADQKGQIEFVRRIAYASGIKGLNAASYGPDVAPYIVTPENAANAIEENGEYYAKNLTTVLDRFNRWMAQ
ncbi:extracellular solute-binding protein [Mesorhizobium abyssinicae]